MIRKIRLISKFITSQPGLQTIAIHMLLNITRSKSNQTVKFDQLENYNMKKIFLEKLYTKYDGETILRHSSKNSKLSISLDQESNVLCSLFFLCQNEGCQTMLKISC